MKKKNLKSLKINKTSISNFGNSIKGGTVVATANCSIELCGPNDNTNPILCPFTSDFTEHCTTTTTRTRPDSVNC